MNFEDEMREIVEEILIEKLVKKNQKYGNSIYNPQMIFNEVGNPELLISVRLDDKMGRLKQLDKSSDKYDSELKEIVGYLLLLINWRKRYGTCSSDNRYKGVQIESSQDTGERTERLLQDAIRRRLSNFGFDYLRKEKL